MVKQIAGWIYLRQKLVPKKGLEPLRSRERQILSLVRLPFRHFGIRL